MFLDYLALVMICISCVAIFYLLIYIHELPYEAAKHRDHPQQEAIYIACWVSLFTLHALWPLIFIWAVSHQGREEAGGDGMQLKGQQLNGIEERLARLEQKVSAKQKGAK